MEPKRLELREGDYEPPTVEAIDPQDIRNRIAAIDAAEITDEVPVVRYRPAGSGRIDLASGLKRILRDQPELREKLYTSIVERAIAGDHNATKLLFDRVDGAVPQRVGIGQLTTEQIAEMLALEVQPSEEDEQPSSE